MSLPLTTPLAPPLRPDESLRLVEASVSEACVLRAEGREPEAIAILKEKLPGLIAIWSRSAGLPGEQCQAILRDMFARVQQQVATATICKRLVLQSVETTGLRERAAAAPGQIRRRVPLHDIPGMLDALDEAERAAAFRPHSLSPGARRPVAALALG